LSFVSLLCIGGYPWRFLHKVDERLSSWRVHRDKRETRGKVLIAFEKNFRGLSEAENCRVKTHDPSAHGFLFNLPRKSDSASDRLA
jgi:hypothetical protein